MWYVCHAAIDHVTHVTQVIAEWYSKNDT